MKHPLPPEIEKGRILMGPLKTDSSAGNNGAFYIYVGTAMLQIVINDGGEWEHISIAYAKKDKTPSWEEACAVKELLFEKDECVIQFHPPSNLYINARPHVLHLWKPKLPLSIPVPSNIYVGYSVAEDATLFPQMGLWDGAQKGLKEQYKEKRWGKKG